MEKDQARKHLKKLNGVSFRRNLKKKSIKVVLTIGATIPLVYEKEERWRNGKIVENREFGEIIPGCCKPLPKKNGKYICRCDKHILRIDKVKNHRASKSIIIQVGEIPEKIFHHDLCKHLCK